MTKASPALLPRHRPRRLRRRVRRTPVLHLRRRRRLAGRRAACRSCSASASPASPARLLAWTGDFDPAIEGHGTPDRQQRRGPGRRQRPPAALPRSAGQRPPAGRGGRRRAARQARPVRRHLLQLRHSTQLAYVLGFGAGVDVLSNSYGEIRRRQRRPRRGEPGGRLLEQPLRQPDPVRCSPPATAHRASARPRRRAPPPACPWARRRSSAAPAGTRSRTTARSWTTT